MSLFYHVKKIDESKAHTDEDNLEVEIFKTGESLCDESLVEDIEKLKDFVKGVYSGRIKTKPIA